MVDSGLCMRTVAVKLTLELLVAEGERLAVDPHDFDAFRSVGVPCGLDHRRCDIATYQASRVAFRQLGEIPPGPQPTSRMDRPSVGI